MIFLFVCFVLAIGILAVVRAHDRSPPRNLVTFLRRMCQESATHRENYRRLSSELADQKQGIRRASSEVLDLQNIVNGLKAQIDYAG